MIGSVPLPVHPLALSVSATGISQNEHIACTCRERSLPLGVLEDSRAAFAMIASKIFSFRRDELDTCLAAHRRKSLRQFSILRTRNVQACLR